MVDARSISSKYGSIRAGLPHNMWLGSIMTQVIVLQKRCHNCTEVTIQGCGAVPVARFLTHFVTVYEKEEAYEERI